MRILTRYVLLELCKVFLAALTSLTILMVVVGVVQEAMRHNLPLGEIMRLIPYVLPESLRITLPVTMLLATTTVYGRMAGSNEIVALKSLGISPVVIFAPAWILAVAMSLVTVWLNDLAVSWGRNGARRVVIQAVEEIAYNMLRTERCYTSPRFSIHVQGVDGRRLVRPMLSITPSGNAPSITVTAREAELRSDRQENVLKIRLVDGAIDVEGEATFLFPDDVYEQEIPLTDASRAQAMDELPSWLALRVISEQTVLQKAEIESYKQELAATAAYQMLSGDWDGLFGPEWRVRAGGLEEKWARLYRLYLEPHRRWAAGFSCFCFLWIGAPMAVWWRKSDFLTSFFLCFVPILVVYYPFLIYSVDASKTGSLPAYSVWAGNLFILLCGLPLLKIVWRY